jgi:hypothetical protein
MSTALVRMKFGALAAKTESTIGTDSIAGSPVAGDFIGAGCEISFSPDVIQIDEYNGSLDKTASIVGGLKPTIRIRMPLRGSGAAGTAPEWGKLLEAATFVATVTASAIGSPTAATAGTTTTVTGAVAFTATANLYNGMPMLLSGDQTATTGITNYTAGRVFTLGETRPLMTTSTNLQIPINVRYAPTSDESQYKTVTLYYYADGLLWTFTGASGTASIELTTGGIGFITFEMRAQFATKSATALPAAAATAANSRVVPPRWVAGKGQFNRTLAQVRTLQLNAGVQVVLPDDPESAQGYGPSVPVERDVSGSIDPLMNTANSVALFSNFTAGTTMNLMAIIGSTAGNRMLVVVPAAKVIAMDPGARDGLGQHGISFQADGADTSMYIAHF